MVQSPYGDAIVVKEESTGQGFNRFHIQLMDSGAIKTAWRHQLFQLDLVEKITQEFDARVDESVENEPDDFVDYPPDIDEPHDIDEPDNIDDPFGIEDLLDYDEIQDISDSETLSEQPPIITVEQSASRDPQSKPRFAKPDSAMDIQRLADERTARLTQYQTRWAVKVFRG